MLLQQEQCLETDYLGASARPAVYSWGGLDQSWPYLSPLLWLETVHHAPAVSTQSHAASLKHKAPLAFAIISSLRGSPSGGNEKSVQLPLKMPHFPLSLQFFI